MAEIICKRCQYKWQYKGDRTLWASCPNCKTSVRIQLFVKEEKNKIKILELALEKQYEDMTNRHHDLFDFVAKKNPLLIEEYNDKLIKDAQVIAEKEVKEVLG